jgi:hypothetical protein
MSPKARFDAVAEVLGFDESSVDAIRYSINPLLKEVNELVRMLNQCMRSKQARALIGDVPEESRDRLQSLLASFIMRTINCSYDEAFCNYAHEVSHGEGVPPNLFSLALTLALDYVVQTLPGKIDDRERLAAMLSAWNKLTAILRELTR